MVNSRGPLMPGGPILEHIADVANLDDFARRAGINASSLYALRNGHQTRIGSLIGDAILATSPVGAPNPTHRDEPDEPRPAWMAKGACVGVNPDLFFPERGAGREDWAEARRICNSCPVRLQCLDYAVTTPEVYGIWGGQSERERRRIRKQRRLSA